MKPTIDDVMVANPIALSRNDTVGRAREVMKEHPISALPVEDEDGHPLGIVTKTDLLAADQDDVPIARLMTAGIYTVARDDGPDHAARLMRRHGIHHVIVIEGRTVCGIVSSLDLLRLVESGAITTPIEGE